MRLRRWLLTAGAMAAAGALIALCLSVIRPEAADPPVSPFGFVVIDIADEQAASSYHVEEMGVYVLAVDEGSHADAAGIRTGDRLLRVNGKAIADSAELFAMQQTFQPQQRIQVELARADIPYTAALIWEDQSEQTEEEQRI